MTAPAVAVLDRLRNAWVALTLVAVLVGTAGWPRDLTCDGGSGPSCTDPTSGSWVAVWVAGVLGVAALGCFVVWAAAVGTRLGLRIEREQQDSVDA